MPNFIPLASPRSLAELNHNLQHSSSSSLVFPGILQQQQQYAAASNAILNRRQAGLSLGNHHRSILVTHPIGALNAGQLPLMNSPSSGNILHVSTFFCPLQHILHYLFTLFYCNLNFSLLNTIFKFQYQISN